jgi:aldehyde dehydrogenase (NAD+)/aldehyde dehydrogenase
LYNSSRILVHEDIADLFIERKARLKLVKAGNPLDPETMIGSQVSKHNAIKSLTISILVKKKVQLVLVVLVIMKETLLRILYQPTVLKGTNDMRVFQFLDQL